jgi:DNA-binding NarL/FixJ family response regulator
MPSFGRWRGRCSRRTGSASSARPRTEQLRSSVRPPCGPDVVLLDIQLPDIDGFEVARQLRDREHPPRVILTSSRSRSYYRRRLAENGAPAFVPKSELSGAALERHVG